jgi:hypothetical protein
MPDQRPRREILDQVGERIIRLVRDSVMCQLDQLIRGELKPAVSRALHERLAVLRTGEIGLLREVAAESIDNCLNSFLWLLEGGEGLELFLKKPSGDYVNVTQLSDGLSGDMHDWVRRFSKYPPTV